LEILTTLPRLEVPLDYDRHHNQTFKLAIAKLPALNPVGPFRGAYFLNFGGETNTNFTKDLGWAYQLGFLTGVDLTGFDIYAVDFRGGGHTTPQLSCFSNQTDYIDYVYRAVNPDNTFGSFNGTFPPTPANIRTNIKTVNNFMSELGRGCQLNYQPYIS
jgi:hypothetical protein